MLVPWCVSVRMCNVRHVSGLVCVCMCNVEQISGSCPRFPGCNPEEAGSQHEGVHNSGGEVLHGHAGSLFIIV